jgi:hypothetical protein
METQDFGVEHQLIVSARDRAQGLLNELRGSPEQPLEIARDRAAAAVERHSAQLIDELVSSTSPDSALHPLRVKECYAQLALEFANAVRDLEPDSERRHAIAQAVQYKILESERRLRAVMEALAPPPAESSPHDTDQ